LRVSHTADTADEDIATTLTVGGPLCSPVVARIDMPLRPVAVVEVAGEASADFTLYGITLYLASL
ncbi:MAG: hypothetical protein K2J17_04760, partial [Paramuribaculum sp.]|nr:hypothetical protein [Paramuribaculum sp.]